jgi:hypothetical protein
MGDLKVQYCLHNVNVCVNTDAISKREDTRAGNVAEVVKYLC